ncbi:MAG: hypothetical protein K2Q06_04145, partial [Parvularculaceae bacterium]|nr:hypothetical protein [Parvularculaceae bacterium]
DPDALRVVYEKSRSGPDLAQITRRALAVEELHAQARGHVVEYGPQRLEIWVLGGTNLTVMKRADLLEKRWKENLLWGVDYTMVWPLDCVDEESFGTVLSTLTALAAKVVAEYPRWRQDSRRAAQSPPWLAGALKENRGETRGHGRIHHVALSILERPRRAMLQAYQQLQNSYAGADGAFGVAHPFIAGHDGTAAPEVATAARRLLRVWHPDTGVVVYRPRDGATPAAANIRLMPVSERIVTRLAPELEDSHYWFWLSPVGARRIVNALVDLEGAVAMRSSEG